MRGTFNVLFITVDFSSGLKLCSICFVGAPPSLGNPTCCSELLEIALESLFDFELICHRDNNLNSAQGHGGITNLVWDFLSVMSLPSSSPATPAFGRISDRDLTEIELHSVESINDLHRTHPEQYHNHKGIRRPPLPRIPSSNGIVCQPNSLSANPKRGRGRLVDMLMPSTFRSGLACAVILFLLLTLILICFLVQQGAALQMLTEALQERQDVATEISKLIQELQALRHNLTTTRP